MCTNDSILIGAQTTSGTLSQQLFMLCHYPTHRRLSAMVWREYRNNCSQEETRQSTGFAFFSGELRISATGTATFQNRTYWKSWSDAANAQKNWVDAGTFCRSLCMDLVALDSAGETDFVSSLIQPGDLLRHCLGCSGLSSRSFVCSYCLVVPKF